MDVTVFTLAPIRDERPPEDHSAFNPDTERSGPISRPRARGVRASRHR